MDATANDRLWSRLEPGRHRDSASSSSSMSSSSSVSSNDTVIDLSLPNLARKRLTSLPAAGSVRDPPWAGCRRSPLPSHHAAQVSKSKSNPNLPQSGCLADELRPRPLQPPQQPAADPAGRPAQRRHTWSRLYMEELKQSLSRKPAAAAGTALASGTPLASGSMSKSLGDLTSDDISSNFDSKYRSISRSFVRRPAREPLRRGGPGKSAPASALTEQLRRLTDVEPLSASDFTPPPQQPPQPPQQDELLVRRTSSRSQSRVRYIANRAKKAQERQRLQGLVQARSASLSLAGGGGGGGGPIEERGNPEGACSVAQSPCSSLDLLSQLAPARPVPAVPRPGTH